MTVALILTALASAFVIGFLLGDRRGVRQCNAILDDHCKTMMKAMTQEPLPAGKTAEAEDTEDRPTVH